jgi:hypothetical protein
MPALKNICSEDTGSMATTLHDLSVKCYLQTLTGVEGFLAKGLAYCEAQGIDPDEIVATRLYPDMFPFSFQLLSVTHHSLGAIRGIEAGVFTPPPPLPTLRYAGWQAALSDARETLTAMVPEAVNALEGKDLEFRFGDFKLPFVAEDFVLSFSLPNLHFHATTAYDILRMKGVPLGKRDYTGPMRIKR